MAELTGPLTFLGEMMQPSVFPFFPIFLFAVCVTALAVAMLIVANVFNPVRPGRVKGMPYESGMDPFHDTRRRFDIRFHLLAIAFMVFDVELLFLYPWAVAMRPANECPAPAIASTNAAPAASQPSPTAASNATTARPEKHWENRNLVFCGAMVFLVLLALGYVYDWRKGVFDWR
jgi:NADH-quinone oxidoreductase subunit A